MGFMLQEIQRRQRAFAEALDASKWLACLRKSDLGARPGFRELIPLGQGLGVSSYGVYTHKAMDLALNRIHPEYFGLPSAYRAWRRALESLRRIPHVLVPPFAVLQEELQEGLQEGLQEEQARTSAVLVLPWGSPPEGTLDVGGLVLELKQLLQNAGLDLGDGADQVLAWEGVPFVHDLTDLHEGWSSRVSRVPV